MSVKALRGTKLLSADVAYPKALFVDFVGFLDHHKRQSHQVTRVCPLRAKWVEVVAVEVVSEDNLCIVPERISDVKICHLCPQSVKWIIIPKHSRGAHDSLLVDQNVVCIASSSGPQFTTKSHRMQDQAEIGPCIICTCMVRRLSTHRD